MAKGIKDFDSFYSVYLRQHQNRTNRILHFVGTNFVLALSLTVFLNKVPHLFLWVPFVGYVFAWVGHFFFEKNRPATFTYPLWSLRSDFKMYFDILFGNLYFDSSKDPK